MMNSSSATGVEGKFQASSTVGQFLTSMRHSAAIKYSQLTEVPFLYVHVIKNTVTTTVNHLDVHYKQPIAHALFSMPSGLLHRLFGDSSQAFVNNDDDDVETADNNNSNLNTIAAVNEQQRMELVYENWTLDDVLHERFTRTQFDFSPPSTWSFPFSVSVAVLRAIMQNNVSLNAIRSLSDINYNFYPPAYHVYNFPSDPTEFDALWYTHGITPIYRLDNVVPPGFDFDTKFKFPAPNSPRKHGQLTIKRFSVHIDQEGHPDVLGGEYMTSDRIINMRKSIMTSMFGRETVQAAERLCKALENAASCRWYADGRFMDLMRSYRGRGFLEESSSSSPQPSNSLIDGGKSTAMIQYMSKPKLELLQSWQTYLMFFERFNADLSYEKIKKCSRSNEKVILYLHGGGYCLMSAASHRGLAWQISAQTDCLVVGINYRRTPEHHFPAALVDATSAYLQLIFPQMPSRHSFDIFDYLNMNVFHPAVISGTAPLLPVSPDRIIIMGDSAGGGLVMSLLLHIKESGYPMPGGAVLLSPWLDLTCSLPSWNKNDKFDYLPRMDGRQYENIMSAFTSWRDDLLVHPLVSPLFGDVNDLCPILIQIGEREYLLDDSLMMAEKMKGRYGSKSNLFRLEVYQDMIHVWHFLEFPFMSRVAFDKIGEFSRRIISDSWISFGDRVSTSTNTEEDSAECYECISIVESSGDGFKRGQHVETVYISNDGQEHLVEGPLKLGGDFKLKPVFEMK